MQVKRVWRIRCTCAEVLNRVAFAVSLSLAELFVEEEAGGVRGAQLQELDSLVDAMPGDKRPALLALLRSLTDLASG